MKSRFKASQNAHTVREVRRFQREEIEHTLSKSPDFQLYKLTADRHNRERMEQLLKKLPAFRKWRRLSRRIDGPPRPAPVARSCDRAAP